MSGRESIPVFHHVHAPRRNVLAPPRLRTYCGLQLVDDTGQCLERELLRHRITTSAVFLGWRAVGHVAVVKVESICRGGTAESASSVTAGHRPGFECAQQGPTDATEPRIRRDVVQIDMPGVCDRTHCEDRTLLNRQEHRTVRRYYPRGNDGRRLITQPSF